ncbi:MAG TPA: hypothetical protein VGL77_08880 [Armatimonadota bacterium]
MWKRWLAVILLFLLVMGGVAWGILRVKTHGAQGGLQRVSALPVVPTSSKPVAAKPTATNPTQLQPTGAAERAQDWFVLPARSGQPMFCPVMLPFTCHYQGVSEDRNQRLTFPSLLDYKFYFVSDNINTACPAFVYRKDEAAAHLTGTTPEKIAEYINRWSATHAIGGELTVTPAGYTGALSVFDVNGKRILQKAYPKPLPYFTLMGRMVEDWLSFRHQSCSPALRAELERPMTTNMETVRWYGEAATMPWRSEKEWAVYRKILNADPNFGEVRHWFANQKGWADGQTDVPTKEAEYARAFLSHPVISAMRECQLHQIKDGSLRKRAAVAFAHGLQIVPEHNELIWHQFDPFISSDLLEGEAQDGGYHSDILQASPPARVDAFLLPAARDYPGNGELQSDLAEYYFYKGQIQKAVPLYLNSTRKVTIDVTIFAYQQAGVGYWQAGQGCSALSCLQEAVKFDTTKSAFGNNAAYTKMAIYRDFLDYRACIDLGQQVCTSQQDDASSELLLLASLESNIPLHATEQPPADTPHKRLNAVDIRRKIIAKRPNDIPALDITTITDGDIMYSYADACLHAGRSVASNAVRRAWAWKPRVPRLARLLADATLSKHPQDIARYTALMAWLAPEISYWGKLHAQALAAGAVEDSNAASMRLLNEWERKANTVRGNHAAQFWQDAPPFIVEYLVMRALATHQDQQSVKALSLFTQYAAAMASLQRGKDRGNRTWEAYLAHLYAFSGKITNQLPAHRREPWLRQFSLAMGDAVQQ